MKFLRATVIVFFEWFLLMVLLFFVVDQLAEGHMLAEVAEANELVGEAMLPTVLLLLGVILAIARQSDDRRVPKLILWITVSVTLVYAGSLFMVLDGAEGVGLAKSLDLRQPVMRACYAVASIAVGFFVTLEDRSSRSAGMIPDPDAAAGAVLPADGAAGLGDGGGA